MGFERQNMRIIRQIFRNLSLFLSACKHKSFSIIRIFEFQLSPQTKHLRSQSSFRTPVMRIRMRNGEQLRTIRRIAHWRVTAVRETGSMTVIRLEVSGFICLSIPVALNLHRGG